MKQLLKLTFFLLIIAMASCNSSVGTTTQSLKASLLFIGPPETNTQNNASRAMSIMLEFNLPIALSSINAKSVLVYKTSDPSHPLPITGIGQLGTNGKILTLCVIADVLEPNAEYTIQLNPGIVSTTGIALKNTTYLHITTGEKIIPEIILTTPNIGDSDVSLTPIIQIKFSQPVKNVNTNDVIIHDEVGNNVAITSITSSQHFVAFTITTEKLKPLTKYIISIKPGITGTSTSTNRSDDSGNPLMLPNQEWYFITGKSSNPEVASVVPCLGEFNVSLFPLIYLQFSTKVNNVNSSTVKVEDQYGNTSSIASMIPSIDGTSYAIALEYPLLASTMYNIKFDSRNITDSYGNYLKVPQSQHFYTGTENIPLARLVTPNNTVDVAVNTTFELSFSKAVRNVNADNIKLQTEDAKTNIMLTPPISGNNNTFTFSPLTPLKPETNYVLILESGITDDNNKALPQTLFNFMTKK